MKKLFGAAFALGFSVLMSAQYMIIGKDSISLEDYKKEYKYGLEHDGIEKTIASTQDFHLLQQFAADKKADTLMSFREKMMDKEAELRNKFFFPKQVIDPVLNGYIADLQNEKQVQIFILQKTEGDKNNYQQIYNDVKSGKLSMEDAISKYTKGNPKPVYMKAGSIDNRLFSELKNLPNNSLTKFYDMPGYFAFAKLLNSRPSLGYLVFGTVSYPKDENSETTKSKIYAHLKAGKSFREVAKLYGSTDHEKENGGVVMGSPTLPDEVHELFKGKKSGYFTPQPILFSDKYFIFNIYNVEPYALNDKNRDFFIRDMNESLYGEVLQDKMLAYLKSDPTYKEFPEFQNVKKSYQNLMVAKDNSALYQYRNHKTTVGDIKKLIADKKDEVGKLSPAVWSESVSGVNTQDLLRFYSEDFTSQKSIKNELDDYKRSLYSDYIFSKYLNEEITKHPELLTDYYNKNKSKYMWGNRADGRVAIIADEQLANEIQKQIKDPKNWETLKAKYYGKLNDKKQILVNFEKGEMSENADVFTKYNVPFKPGVYQTKMTERTLVIAIDKILPASQMSRTEAEEQLKDAVTEQKLRETIAIQKAKTKIVIQPEFTKDLEKNFKK